MYIFEQRMSLYLAFVVAISLAVHKPVKIYSCILYFPVYIFFFLTISIENTLYINIVNCLRQLSLQCFYLTVSEVDQYCHI